MSSWLAPVVASLVWSLNPALVSKWARNSPPLLFTSFRALMALIFLLALVNPVLNVYLGFGESQLELSKRVLFIAVLSAIVGPGLGDALYVKSIQILGGSLAVMISYTYVLFAGIFAGLLDIEDYTVLKAVGSTLAIAGVVVAVFKNSIRFSAKGIIYALLTAVSWGLATVLIRMVRGYMDPVTLSMIRLVVVFIAMLFASVLVREKLSIDRGFVAAASATGVLGWGIGMVLFTYSIYTIGPLATAVATALTPILSQITTRFIAGEKPTLRVFIGVTLVAIGIFVVSFDINV